MAKERNSITKSITFSPKALSRIDDYLEDSGLSMTAFVNMACTQYLDQKEAMAAMNNIHVLMEKINEFKKNENDEGNEKDSKKWGW